ncbi:holo-ACP synthase [Hirschia baltica]|uniref:Holo-[acyl-carrier-protein] synthase n=1 Tax=Hirschia baltica (strain ATCC 49814 / DSM 5838 / IFAM 1418) TaxID=582402 RepID=C6XJG4_HIRBI|nr:holo-ACP synthase [Hirschia baltica]ACT59259.1 holo-acyl-carrier-protein synthase [Hirschia baltica ATCC 49814]
MILGIGQDMTDIRRIEKSLSKFGDRFTQRVFTKQERELADGRKRRADTYAKRFAAKEACAKALGSGIWRNGVGWQDIGVTRQENGAPTLELSGGAKLYLEKLTPDGMKANIHLTITDDYPYAQAMVIIEAIAVQGA